jgi:hypothetical protein
MCVTKEFSMQLSIEMQDYKRQNKFWPIYGSKVLAYSDERDIECLFFGPSM